LLEYERKFGGVIDQPMSGHLRPLWNSFTSLGGEVRLNEMLGNIRHHLPRSIELLQFGRGESGHDRQCAYLLPGRQGVKVQPVFGEQAMLDAEANDVPGFVGVQVLAVHLVPTFGNLIAEPGTGHRLLREHMGDRLYLGDLLLGLEDLGRVEGVEVGRHLLSFVLPLGSPVVGVVGAALAGFGVVGHGGGRGRSKGTPFVAPEGRRTERGGQSLYPFEYYYIRR